MKSESEIKTNYEASTALVPARYEAGVKTATWQGEALAGQDLYVEQMTNAAILARRAKGIEKVSDEAWKRAAIDKGKSVIGSRMKAASGKQIEGYRPYREALLAVDLPARSSDPMQNLINRAGPVIMAMVDKKKEISG